LRWAAANEGRAASTYDEELKALFLRIAAQYRAVPRFSIANWRSRTLARQAHRVPQSQTGI